MYLDNQTKAKEITKDQVILQQKAQIDKLKALNEKLQKKVEYYESFMENITQFEKTQNIINLKGFLTVNYKKFDSLIEELYKVKEELELENMQHCELKTRYNNLLQNNNINKNDKENINAAQNGKNGFEDNAKLQEQIKAFQTSIEKLSKEVDDLTEKNHRYLQLLQKKDFFQEYEKLLKEIEGLRKQNHLVTEKLKQKMQND